MQPSDPTAMRRDLTALHLALCLGCAAFMGVTIYLWSTGMVPLSGEEAVPELSVLALVAGVLLPALAMLLFRQRIRALPLGAPFGELATGVRAACILHWALIEGALFFDLIVFMLQADTLHLGVSLALLALLVLRAPSERKLQRWLTGTA
jgi:hypothetical protein